MAHGPNRFHKNTLRGERAACLALLPLLLIELPHPKPCTPRPDSNPLLSFARCYCCAAVKTADAAAAVVAACCGTDREHPERTEYYKATKYLCYNNRICCFAAAAVCERKKRLSESHPLHPATDRHRAHERAAYAVGERRPSDSPRKIVTIPSTASCFSRKVSGGMR